MVYTAHRDYRFEYVMEAMNHVEVSQCFECKFRKDDNDEYPMCYEIEAPFMLEEPVEEIDDLGDKGLLCKKFQPES